MIHTWGVAKGEREREGWMDILHPGRKGDKTPIP